MKKEHEKKINRNDVRVKKKNLENENISNQLMIVLCA